MKKRSPGKAKRKRAPIKATLASPRAPRPAKTPERARPPVVPPARGPRLAVRMVAEPAPYAEVSIHEPVTEASIERLFQHARGELLRQKPRRVLVDMLEAQVKLSISDLNGLAKLVAGSFMGLVDRLAIVMRQEDMLPEKFFEPSMIHRGMPTYVSVDRNDAIDWLLAKQWPS